MESTARRRLLLISSHLCPSAQTSSPTCLSASSCRSQKDNSGEIDCVFCTIIRGEAPAFKVYEDDACLCILDTQPLSLGHLLIIPKCHFPSLDMTPPLIIGAMCSKVPMISNAVMKATGCDSFNLLVNNGKAAGQVIYHTHIHIIPRKSHDCLWASEVNVFSSPGVTTKSLSEPNLTKDKHSQSLRRRPLKIDQEASELVDCIRVNLTSLNECEDNKRQATSLIGN